MRELPVTGLVVGAGGRRALARLLLVLLCWQLGGCESTSWLWQAARGQWQLQRQARPVDQLLADPGTDPALRQRLKLVAEISEFGEQQLGLDASTAFRSYVQLSRPYVVWNVFAVPEFAIEARQWCFPIAGCVSYRGYFTESAAQAFAADLDARGFDTWVGGVAAYSTLGWLEDPVLSTWLWREPTALAALVFHELAHSRLYVAGDTRFSESLASLLEAVLVERWLRRENSLERFDAYQRRLATRARFAALVECTWQRLSELYRRELAPPQMRQAKQQVLTAMRDSYRAEATSWPEPQAFDAWMAGPLNNARLLSVISYQSWVPALRRLYEAHGGQLDALLEQLEQLSRLSPEDRSAFLQQQQGVGPAGDANVSGCAPG